MVVAKVDQSTAEAAQGAMLQCDSLIHSQTVPTITLVGPEEVVVFSFKVRPFVVTGI